MQNEFHADLVTEIVQSIFSTMIGLDVSVSDTPWSSKGDRLTSTVYLEGDWNGAVSFECSGEHACQIAGHFMAAEPPAAVDDDVRDVLGELANMIGGNVKSVIATDVRLSLPSVIDGSNYELHVCGSDTSEKMAFQFPGGVFWVSVLKKGCQNKRTDEPQLTARVM